MILGVTRSAPFLLFRVFLVLIFGGLFALFKLAIFLLLFSYVLAPLTIATYGALRLQDEYPTLIEDFFNDPAAESQLIGFLNQAISVYNLVIQLLAYLVDIWDYFVPTFYLVWNQVEQIVPQILQVIFGTPKIQCILADLAKVAVEVLEHGAIDVNRIFHTVTQFMQSEQAGRLFAKFAAEMGSCDPNDPEQVFGCPQQGTVLQLFVVALKLAMDLGTIASQFLTPFLISFFRTVFTQLLQWFPAVVKILSAIFSSLLNSGAIGIILNIIQNALNEAEVLFNLFCPLFAISSTAVCEVIVVLEATVIAVIDAIESVICGLEGWFAPAPNIQTSDIQEQENITRQLEKIYAPFLADLDNTEKVLTFQELLTDVLNVSDAQLNALSEDLSQSARDLDLVATSYDEFIAQTSTQLADVLGEDVDMVLAGFIAQVIARDTYSGFTDKLSDFRMAELLSQICLFSNTESIDAFGAISDRAVTLASVDQLLKPINIVEPEQSGLLGKSSFCKSKTGASTLKAFGTNSKACGDILNSTCAGINFGKDIEDFVEDIVMNVEDAANLTEIVFRLIPGFLTNITTLFEETVQIEASLIEGIVQDITGSVEFIVNTGLLNSSIQELVDDLNFEDYDSATLPNSNPTQQGFNLRPYTCCSFPADNSSQVCCDGTAGFPPSDNGGAFDLCTLRSDNDATAATNAQKLSDQIRRTVTLLDDNQERIAAAQALFQNKNVFGDALNKMQALFDTARPFFDVDDAFFATPDAPGDNDPSCKATPEDPYRCCTASSSTYQCCRGLVGCIPPIPVDSITINVTITNNTIQWLRALEDRETCADFSNGFKELLFLIRLVTNQPISDLIANVPSFAQPLYEVLFGWLTFGDAGFPEYAWVCFLLNIGGLLLLVTILLYLAVLGLAFGPWVQKLFALSEDYYLQREISAENNPNEEYAEQYLPSGAQYNGETARVLATLLASMHEQGDNYVPTPSDLHVMRQALARLEQRKTKFNGQNKKWN